MKKFFVFFFLLFFSFSLFCHSIGVVFAEDKKEVHCHGGQEKKLSWNCCFISKDFSTEKFQKNIESTKISKKQFEGFQLFFNPQEILYTKTLFFSHKKYIFDDPPPNDYTSLTGIIKQLK